MITADLRAEPEYAKVGKNRVACHMKEMGLRCRATRKFVVTTDSKHNEPIDPNILDRKFTVSAPKRAWVSDITYVKVGSQWNYLTVFIDLYSRSVVDRDLSASLERHSMMHAFQKALWRRRPKAGLLVHSDRGVQYASSDFRKLLKKKGVVQSMSRGKRKLLEEIAGILSYIGVECQASLTRAGIGDFAFALTCRPALAFPIYHWADCL